MYPGTDNSHRSTSLISLFVGLAIALFSATAVAGEPTSYIKKQTDQVTELLAQEESEERARKFSQKAQEVIDFRTLASRALGEHWEGRSEDDRKRFLSLLQELLEANYKKKLEGHEVGEDYQIEYLDEKRRDDRAIVKTLVKWGESEKERKPVEYKLMRQDQNWIVYDVVIDDISLEATYRDSYTEIIEKEGWDALIEKMQSKVDKLRKEAKTDEG